MQWLFLIIGVVLGAIIGAVCVTIYYKRGLSAQQKQLQEDAVKAEENNNKLIADAQKDAENRKRELLLQAKEEISKARVELEHDVREKRQELARERNKLEQKEDNVDKMLANAEQKRAELDKRLQDVAEMQARTKDLEFRKSKELESISGLSIQEARTLVLEAAEREYSHDMATMLKQMEEKTKQDADRIAKDIIVTSIQRYASDYVSEATVSVVNLPNDEMKGRIHRRYSGSGNPFVF